MVSALRDPPELREHGARGAVVHRPRDFVLVGDQPQLLQLRIPDVPQPHQVGARLFERREVLLQVRLGAALDPVAQLARTVADHLVHGGQEVLGLLAVVGAALAISSFDAANSSSVLSALAASSA